MSCKPLSAEAVIAGLFLGRQMPSHLPMVRSSSGVNWCSFMEGAASSRRGVGGSALLCWAASMGKSALELFIKLSVK